MEVLRNDNIVGQEVPRTFSEKPPFPLQGNPIAVQLLCRQAALRLLMTCMGQIVQRVGQSPELRAQAVAAQLHRNQLPEETQQEDGTEDPDHEGNVTQEDQE